MPKTPDSLPTEPPDDLRSFLIRVDSVTSWVAHRVNRNVLGDETERELLAVSAEARRRYTEMDRA